MREVLKKRKKVSVYTRSGEIGPAGYYRLLQYSKKIEEHKFKSRTLLLPRIYKLYHSVNKESSVLLYLARLTVYPLMVFRLSSALLRDLMWKPDIIIVSRALIPRKLPIHIRILFKRNLKNSALLWDFDDHILETGEINQKDFDLFCELSKNIVVTHRFLKTLVPDHLKEKVLLLPTTDGDMLSIDLKIASEKRKLLFKEEVHLVWVATSGNLPHLRKVIQELDKAAYEVKTSLGKKLILNVVCNLPLKQKTSYLKINNIKWTKLGAIQSMTNSHIGIMPLMDSNFTKGKGAFKLIQYMAIGLPVIASKVGFNEQVIDENCGYLIPETGNENMWSSTILEITKNWSTWKKFSEGSYIQWEKKFSFHENLYKWKEIINKAG